MPLLVVLIVAIASSALSQTPQPMQDILSSKEALVEQLAAAAQWAYENRCSMECPSCVLSACSSPKPPDSTNCSSIFGSETVRKGDCSYQCSLRKLDFTTSNILTARKHESDQVRQERCWTSVLDQEFLDNHRNLSNGRDLRWQYFASDSGLVRLYPAHTLNDCHPLNPLIRPWYVAATSGPKNVVLVLDVSSSVLNYGRLNLSKAAAITVVETLTNVDYVAVVTFNDTAEQLLVDGQLLRASYSNITNLTQAIEEQLTEDSVGGGTNYEAAFNKAFDILDLNSGSPNWANCSTALLFLTDGYPNKGSTSQDFLTDLVRQRNQRHNAIIFTYTLGSNSGGALTQGIACATGGVYTHIEDGGNLREQLSLYYDYFALLRETDNLQVAWVEPYEDAVGAGRLVTGSKAVYDTSHSPPKLVGVVGLDILVSDLREHFESRGMDYREVVEYLASRNACPTTAGFNESVLNVIRVRGGGEACGVSNEDVMEVVTTVSCSDSKTSDYCEYMYRRYASDKDGFREESCCFDDGGSAGPGDMKHITQLSCDSSARSVHFQLGAEVSMIAVLVVLVFSGVAQ